MNPRSIPVPLIANIAIPTALIVAVLLVGALLTGGVLLLVVYLVERLSSRAGGSTGQ